MQIQETSESLLNNLLDLGGFLNHGTGVLWETTMSPRMGLLRGAAVHLQLPFVCVEEKGNHTGLGDKSWACGRGQDTLEKVK